jgi:mRNA interferase RelE/StbE
MNLAWKIEFDPRARAEFSSLDKTIQRRIVKFLDRLKDNPRRHGAALRGETLGNYWKYRVGDYRLIADIRDSKLVVLIVAIGHRSDVYR